MENIEDKLDNHGFEAIEKYFRKCLDEKIDKGYRSFKLFTLVAFFIELDLLETIKEEYQTDAQRRFNEIILEYVNKYDMHQRKHHPFLYRGV